MDAQIEENTESSIGEADDSFETRATVSARFRTDHSIELAGLKALDLVASEIFIVDKTGALHYGNEAFKRAAATDSDDLVMLPISDLLHPDDAAFLGKLLTVTAAADLPQSFELRLRTSDGFRFYDCSLNTGPWEHPTGPLFMATLRDVTEHVKSRDEVAALQQECMRLRDLRSEAFHRLKNNLQVLVATVDMMRQDTEDGSITAEEAGRLSNTVRSISVLNDLLTHQSKADDSRDMVSFQAMAEQLIPVLGSTIKESDTLHTFIDNIELDPKKALCLALIAQELISNAVKHATGEISLTFGAIETEGILQVRDSGAGFPPHFNPKAAANTGLELLDRLTRWDLRGTITFANSEQPNRQGGVVTVRFPL